MRAQTKDILAKLVSFDSVSHKSNLPLLDYVEDYLSSFGIESRRVFDESGEKANLYAQIGPNVDGGVVLSGHTDVVPVADQNWLTDPFTLFENNGRLYGRGTCDMKGFLALMLSAVPDMVQAGLKAPIQLAFSYDEETGCLGAPSMINEMAEKLPRAKAVIVGEPSMMKVVNGHKGIVELETTIFGYAVHSSLVHTGVSAVNVAAKMITWHMDQMAQNARNIDPAMLELAYVPPYTTLHNGVIRGGTAHNITADEAYFLSDIRPVPTERNEMWIEKYRAFVSECEADIQRIHADCKIDVNIIATTPALRTERNGPAEALARMLTGDNANNVVSYATEGGQFQDGGYSVCVCGPGSIEQAHQPNEYIEISQLRAGEEFIQKIIEHLS